MASKIPPRSGSIQEDLTPLGSATMSSATTAAAAPATSYPTSGGPPRIGEDIIRSRRASDASITSFLNGTEFSHILGAYAERFRWDDDGLYGFDESIEQAEEEDEEVSESQAVKTAEEGSAKIVRARGRACAAIESEIGPSEYHEIVALDSHQPPPCFCSMLSHVMVALLLHRARPELSTPAHPRLCFHAANR